VLGQAASVQELPFRGSRAVARGRTTKGRLRGPRFVRLLPDVYMPAGVPIDHLVLSLAAAKWVSTAGGIVSGYSAATLLGADCAPRDAPAEVLVRGHVRSQPRLRVTRGSATGADRWTVRGYPMTSPLRTAWDLARRLEVTEAVVALDALAARGGFATAALLHRRAGSAPVRGGRRLDRVVELADPRAESPMESRLRLLLVLAGLPAPEVQFPLVADRYLVARFDLAYPAATLAVEYDGAGHVDDLDRRRDVRTGRLGWYTARFTRHDIAGPTATADAVATLLAERTRLFGRREWDTGVPVS
jgi:very-short-patch-repair endonuclease